MRKLLTTLLLALACCIAAQAQLPSVNLKNLKGATVNSSTIAKNGGKPVIVSFFATWCKPCMRELKAIAELYPEWQDETGVKMYIISIDEAQNASKVKPLVDANSWEYEVLLDSNSALFKALGLQSVPHVMVLDGNGKIAYSHSGYTDGSESEIIKTVRKLSKKK